MKKKYILMGVAAALITTTIIGGSLAAFQADNNVQQNINTRSLEIELTSDEAARGNLYLENVMPGGEINKSINIENTADTPLYARVTIRKYWGTHTEGSDTVDKEFNNDANKISVEAKNKGNWLEDEAARDSETSVFYYRMPLNAGEKVDIMDALTIKVDTNLNNDYADKGIGLDVEVDAVQTFAGEDAMLSEWGVWANIAENGLITSIEE